MTSAPEGKVNEGTFESKAEVARKELEAKYLRMRQLTSELRGRDLELARLLEDKRRLLGVGLEALSHPTYLHLVQERKDGEQEGGTKEQVLEQVQEAGNLASHLNSSGMVLGRSAPRGPTPRRRGSSRPPRSSLSYSPARRRATSRRSSSRRRHTSRRTTTRHRARTSTCC